MSYQDLHTPFSRGGIRSWCWGVRVVCFVVALATHLSGNSGVPPNLIGRKSRRFPIFLAGTVVTEGSAFHPKPRDKTRNRGRTLQTAILELHPKTNDSDASNRGPVTGVASSPVARPESSR